MGKDSVTDNRIRKIAAAVIFVFVLIILFGTVMFTYVNRFESELTKQNTDRLAETAIYSATYMTTVVEATKASLNTAAMAMADMSLENSIEYLTELVENHDVAYMAFADNNGNIYSTFADADEQVKAKNLLNGASLGASSVSDLNRMIFKDHISSGIFISVPCNVEGKSGILISMLEVDTLRTAFDRGTAKTSGSAYIIDSSGSIVMGNKSLDIWSLFETLKSAVFEHGHSLSAFEQSISNKEEGLICYTLLGVKKYAYYYPLEFNDWTVVNIVPDTVVSEKTLVITREITIAGSIVILIFMLLLLAVLRYYNISQDSRSTADAKSAFLANMSHEIRTPLNAIVGISEIMLRQDMTLKNREQVLNIHNSGKGLLTIINDVLDISKIESGRFNIVPEKYDLESLLYDITAIITIRIKDKPVEFLIEIDQNMPRFMVGDMGRIKQILLNIIGNAVKFTERGAIWLRLNAKELNQGWLFTMEVEDTGIGIREEDMSRLFESFNQVDVRRNRNIEGTGLGLAITKRLCEMMGGTITLTSRYGQGSKFIMTLKQGIDTYESILPPINEPVNILALEPNVVLRGYEAGCMARLGIKYEMCSDENIFLEKLESAAFTHALAGRSFLKRSKAAAFYGKTQLIGMLEHGQHTLAQADGVDIHMPLFSLHLIGILTKNINSNHGIRSVGVDTSAIESMPYVSILIVDDNEVNVQVAAGLMSPYEMSMGFAYSGKEAIEAISGGEYDMIFMDHMMPGMDGIQATPIIRNLPGEKYKTLPIVALTANVGGDSMQLFLQNGFDDFLSKPIETKKLNQVLKKYLKPVNDKRMASSQYTRFSQSTADEPVEEISVYSDEVDFALGISYIKSRSKYVNVLKTYVSSAYEKLPLLKNWLEYDKKRFLIEIHGLKTANASIGALGLSQMAEKMELNCRQEKYDDMADLLFKFLEKSHAVLCDVENFINKELECVEEPEKTIDKNKRLIAVVDDNPVNIEVAKSVLCPEFAIADFTGGAQLLNYLEQHKPDMILLDIQMPNMDGYETLECINKNPNWSDIPVIFLTGQRDIKSERKGFKLGARDFITKPFDTVIMLSRIRLQMELYLYQKELALTIDDKTHQVEDLQHIITVSWAEVIESRDGTTGSHVRNTTRYFNVLLDILSKNIDYGKKIEAEAKNALLRASALHDIGKIGISDMVLKKPGPLSHEEFDYMKLHTKIGGDMIQKIIDNTHPDQFLTFAYNMAMYHHERWDGMGYPKGLAQNEIPWYVQALSIADVFDALTAVRPYKKAFSFDETIDIMSKDNGKFYNPALFDIFMQNKEIFKEALDTKPA